MENKKYSLGVIVGRFQVAFLHQGHMSLIKTALEECGKVVVFLGVSEDKFTPKEPLPYAHREQTFKEQFKEEVMTGRLSIVPLLDVPGSNDIWVGQLDTLISIFNTASVMVYGSRDSFLSVYQKHGGAFNAKEVSPKVYISGTEMRKQISEDSHSNPWVRKGIIHAVMNSKEPKE